jgi:hypothetical protein
MCTLYRNRSFHVSMNRFVFVPRNPQDGKHNGFSMMISLSGISLWLIDHPTLRVDGPIRFRVNEIPIHFVLEMYSGWAALWHSHLYSSRSDQFYAQSPRFCDTARFWSASCISSWRWISNTLRDEEIEARIEDEDSMIRACSTLTEKFLKDRSNDPCYLLYKWYNTISW